jgi:hypothetical protein
VVVNVDATRRPLIALLLTAFLAAAGLTGCSGDDGANGRNGSHAPALPTTPPNDGALLCGILPRASAATALDRPAGTLEASGRLAKDKRSGHVHGTCRVASETGDKSSLTIEVIWPSTKQASAVQSLIGTGTPYTFPSSFAPGVGYYNGPGTDVTSQAVASVVWGDYVISALDDEPASGRDALDDSVALVHQVVAVLHLPDTPS